MTLNSTLNENLFVCHSQAQLILACGLAKGRFNTQKNTLILFQDFLMHRELEMCLRDIFDAVCVRVGEYPESEKAPIKKIFRLRKDFNFLKKTLTKSYNKVFVVCDQNLQELYILKKALKLNPNTELIWLEDGSYPYFLNVENKKGSNKYKLTIQLRKIIFKYVFGLGYIYNFEGNYMSGNTFLKTAYLTLPEFARPIFNNKTLVKIKKEDYLLGIKSMFKNTANIPYESADILILFDKFDTYNNRENIESLCKEIITVAHQKNKNVAFKLHPREEEELKFLDNAIALNRNYGFEFYINQILIKSPNLQILGFKSTTLQVAKFFDLRTYSLFPFLDEENDDLCAFYNNLQIQLIEDAETLKKLI